MNKSRLCIVINNIAGFKWWCLNLRRLYTVTAKSRREEEDLDAHFYFIYKTTLPVKSLETLTFSNVFERKTKVDISFYVSVCIHKHYNPWWISNTLWHLNVVQRLTQTISERDGTVLAPFMLMQAAWVWQWRYACLHFSPTSSQLYTQSLHSHTLC